MYIHTYISTSLRRVHSFAHALMTPLIGQNVAHRTVRQRFGFQYIIWLYYCIHRCSFYQICRNWFHCDWAHCCCFAISLNHFTGLINQVGATAVKDEQAEVGVENHDVYRHFVLREFEEEELFYFFLFSNSIKNIVSFSLNSDFSRFTFILASYCPLTL